MTSVTHLKEEKRSLAGEESRVLCRGWSQAGACRSIRGVTNSGPAVRVRYTKIPYDTDRPETSPASIWNAAGFFGGRRCEALLWWHIQRYFYYDVRGVFLLPCCRPHPRSIFGEYERL